nr:hypothetical protein [Tanacetum cinerariifolium]
MVCADAQVPAATLTAAPSRLTAAPKKRKRVVIRDPEESNTSFTIIPTEAKSKDKGKGILVKEPKPLKKQAQIKQDEAFARELKAELKRNIDWDELINHKTKERIDEEESSALKRLNETQADKAAKRQKLDEEVEELKRHLQIVPNDEDDVYTKATPLALKIPVVDYEIYNEQNKPYYKIKRADGSHQLYISFLIERKYPLTKFTVNQMLNNVLLEVEDESELSLEFLSFRVDAAEDLEGKRAK